MKTMTTLRKIRLVFALVMSFWLVWHGSVVMAASFDEQFCEHNYILFSCANDCSNADSSKGGGPSTVDGGGCGGTTEENKKQVWDFLRAHGLSEEATAGMMGNFEQESTFNPKIVNPIGCIGLAQWCGGRINDLKKYATDHNKPYDCLGLQLEFVWYEMVESNDGEQGRHTAPSNSRNPGDHLEMHLDLALNGANFKKKSIYDGLQKSGPFTAAVIFHDYFERANTSTGEDQGRGERAEKLYKEFTGKDAGGTALSGGSTTRDGGSQECTAGGLGGQAAGDCPTLVTQFRALRDQGKTKPDSETHRKWNDHDLDHCTTDPITCGTGGGEKDGGVNPLLLHAIVDAIMNSGASVLTTWSFNTGHGCDGKNHPRGMALDIKCKGNSSPGGTGASEDCNKLFAYFHKHYKDLKLTELIWQYPPAGYSCDDGITLCNISGHTDHIHVGARVRS
jgi:hypothetical protein